MIVGGYLGSRLGSKAIIVLIMILVTILVIASIASKGQVWQEELQLRDLLGFVIG